MGWGLIAHSGVGVSSKIINLVVTDLVKADACERYCQSVLLLFEKHRRPYDFNARLLQSFYCLAWLTNLLQNYAARIIVVLIRYKSKDDL